MLEPTEKPKEWKVRGTAIIDRETGETHFTPQQEGRPVQKSVKRAGRSSFFETVGDKQGSFVAHLSVDRNSSDPAAEMFESLRKLTEDILQKEPKMPTGKSLMKEPRVTVWHKVNDGKIVVRMVLDVTTETEITSQLLSLTQEVNKCLAINRTSLRPPKK